MAALTIDNVRLEVSDDKNLLELALESGIYIPHLCYHPNLPAGEFCRLCVVEVEGESEPVASCTLQPRDGMVVRTKSERLTKLRALALELLLAGHPEDCTTCPKYGNCELQTLIQYIGPSTGRLRMRFRGFAREERNPLLEHEMNRCVLCGRCVRACNDLRGVEALQYQKKGMEFYVGTLNEKLLADAGCRFCGACAEVCPTGTIRDKLRKAEAHWGREEQAVPCRASCPAEIDIPRYVRLVKEGDYNQAAAVIREKAPFPLSLGHICNRLCEGGCKRGDINEPLSIRNLKRIAAQRDTGEVWRGRGKQLEDTGKRVCVVGAGPAGMTAAYYLRKQGHEVTIKEALPQAGGMMRYGIPEYRLPAEVVEWEYGVIAEAGVRLETGERVEHFAELLDSFDAVLLALGTHQGVRLPVKGADLEGVLLNTDFLRNVRMGEEDGLGKKVVVLGGGNVAFDCARTARRLGAQEVSVACLESRQAMLADDEEIEQAIEEGIQVYPGRSFEEIIGEGRVAGVCLMEVEDFSLVDGKAVVTKREGSEHCVEADTVIFAVGQRTNLDASAQIPLSGPGRVAMAPDGTATEMPGIFAAGDMVYGTKSVIQAVASGRQAAEEIDRYLGGSGDIAETLADPREAAPYLGRMEGFASLSRQRESTVSPDERMDGFELVDLGYCETEACGEASRCLQCDLRLQLHRPRLWADYSE